MLRRALTLLLAGLVVIIFVSIGAALTFDRGPLAGRTVVASSIVRPSADAPGAGAWPEAGTLIVTGGVLIGLAAVVRRAS